MRLEAVGQGMAVRKARTLLGVSGFLWAVDLGSRSGQIGLITLDVNCAGARSAGNPLATCDVAGAGNQLTVRIGRHSQRKRGATDRPELGSIGASPRPYRGRILRCEAFGPKTLASRLYRPGSLFRDDTAPHLVAASRILQPL